MISISYKHLKLTVLTITISSSISEQKRTQSLKSEKINTLHILLDKYFFDLLL